MTKKQKIFADISIHAPTKGATDIPPRPDARHPISIHAPTKGATVLQVGPI